MTPLLLLLLLLLLFSFLSNPLSSHASTDPSDLAVLQALIRGVVNNSTSLSDWTGTDPCGDGWSYVECTGGRVTQLQLKGASLQGTLPSNLNSLTKLQQIALQGNSFQGPLPSLSGLSELTVAYLGGQRFTSIPSDFFNGLTSLSLLTLEDNPLNATSGGWSLPTDLSSSSAILTLSLTNTSLTGSIPDFLGNLSSLQELRLAYNHLSGSLPASFANLAQLTRLELNNQDGTSSLSGSIDVVGSMPSLKILWLQVNGFSGTIPASLGSALSLSDCRLNDNNLLGLIPSTFASSSSLQVLQLQNNRLLGPVPAIAALNSSTFVFSGNNFCVEQAGAQCAPDVTALLFFLADVNYPSSLVDSWSGNDPCSSWQGITCDSLGRNVSAVNLPKSELSGTISPYLGNLTSLTKLVLSGNNLTGTIPESLARLPNLVLLDVSNNDIYGPVPSFGANVSVVLTGNANINSAMPPTTEGGTSSGTAGGGGSGSGGGGGSGGSEAKKGSGSVAAIVAGVAAALVVAALVAAAVALRCRKKRRRVEDRNGAMVRPEGNGEMVKRRTANGTVANGTVANGSSTTNKNVQVLEAGNLVISIELLRNVTNDFSEENVLGRGGFGVVYKGELDDGTKIAVKRMASSSSSYSVTSNDNNKGFDEFQAEIAVLTKVRHRHLVALLGYCIERNEKILVYEFMPQGPLSRHLFQWKQHNLAPLAWDRRLSIALDMARGVEYLHGLAQQSFIHRDLKPSNVLLADDFRAKVSDFGLVKLAPDGNTSLETRLAGTFGYLAPEYAVTGRITTKSDVFSFGVMLMELLTGRPALVESLPDDRMHLVTWFGKFVRGKGHKEAILSALDPVIEVNDQTLQSILTVAELSGYCTLREPNKRPDMSHAVNVLSPLVEQWKPNETAEEDGGIDLDLPLSETLKRWQEYADNVSMSADNVSRYGDGNTRDSVVSIPPCPSELVQTFSSTDGR